MLPGSVNDPTGGLIQVGGEFEAGVTLSSRKDWDNNRRRARSKGKRRGFREEVM